jgi:predicted kinase
MDTSINSPTFSYRGQLNIPTLYIFSGLPASGKSTLAKLLAVRTGSMYIRVDTVEQGLRDLCNIKVEGEGYRLSYRIIADNLSLGLSSVSDSCNPIELTRNEWQEVAKSTGAKFVNIEIICSDATEHKHRVETRECEVPNLTPPNWQKVQNRHYEPWKFDVICIDTSGQTIEASFEELVKKLGI